MNIKYIFQRKKLYVYIYLEDLFLLVIYFVFKKF
jgi:hypothetical protein